MLRRIRIKGATIVSMDPKIGIIDSGDLLIDGGKIVAVGRNLGSWAVIEIDGRGMIAMPGFVNGHIHLWQTALRGIAADWTLDHYFSVLIGKVVGLYTPQDAYIGNLVGALDQINSGVTTLFDWCHIVNTPAHADAAVDALKEAGIRAIFAYGTPMTLFGTKEPHPADARRMRHERLVVERGAGDDGARHPRHRLCAGHRRSRHQLRPRPRRHRLVSRRLRQAWAAAAVDAEPGPAGPARQGHQPGARQFSQRRRIQAWSPTTARRSPSRRKWKCRWAWACRRPARCSPPAPN